MYFNYLFHRMFVLIPNSFSITEKLSNFLKTYVFRHELTRKAVQRDCGFRRRKPEDPVRAKQNRLESELHRLFILLYLSSIIFHPLSFMS